MRHTSVPALSHVDWIRVAPELPQNENASNVAVVNTVREDHGSESYMEAPAAIFCYLALSKYLGHIDETRVQTAHG